MRTKIFYFISFVLAVNLSLVACQKAGEKGAEKKLGSGRNDGKSGPAAKVTQQDLLAQSQEVFKACQSASLDGILSLEGFAKYTLTGKNLESVLKALTRQASFQAGLEELEKSRKELHTMVITRLNVASDLIKLNKDLSAKEKFLFSESALEMAFPLGDHALSGDEIAEMAKKFEQNNAKVFENVKLIDDLSRLLEQIKSEGANSASVEANKKAVSEKTESFVKDQTTRLEEKKSRIKTIVDRIAKKDKDLKAEYNTLSKELVVLSGTLEMKSCSQMAIEKTGMNGDLVNFFAQATKSAIELESINGTKR